MMVNDIHNHMRVTKTIQVKEGGLDLSRSMPRKPRKFKPGSGFVQITFLVDSTTAHEIDGYAEQMTKEDPMRPASRTDALRKIMRAGLNALTK